MYSCDGKAEFSDEETLLIIINLETAVLLNIFVETIFFSILQLIENIYLFKKKN